MMTVDGQKPSQSRVSDPAIRAITRSKKAARRKRFIFGVRFPASVLMPHRTDSASQKRSFTEDENGDQRDKLGPQNVIAELIGSEFQRLVADDGDRIQAVVGLSASNGYRNGSDGLAQSKCQCPDVVARRSRRLLKITRPRSRISLITRCSWSSKYGL